MTEPVVRITSIEINNFKNVLHGVVCLTKDVAKEEASVLGLYGQNGSGKTALVESLQLLKLVLSGSKIPAKYLDYINVNSDKASFVFKFDIYMLDGSKEYSAEYSFSLVRKAIDGSNLDNHEDHETIAEIVDEVLKSNYIENHVNISPLRTIVDVHCDDDIVFQPQTKYADLMGKTAATKIALLTEKRIAALSSRSFIFSPAFIKAMSNEDTDSCWKDLIRALILFGNLNLFVIKTSYSGLVSLNALPISFKIHTQAGRGSMGSIAINLNGATLVPNDAYTVVKAVIDNMNTVLCQLIPGMIVEIKNLGHEVDKKGNECSRIQLMSKRGGSEFPLAYESEGIKKIISILQLLTVMFNSPAVTVVIDEIDSGIFEYLLGELLRIISEYGEGQLIFTSHNLRPLETLDKKYIAFTTMLPEDRYTRLKYVKTNHNLRDMYFRDIVLGDQDDTVYDGANNSEIALAFREAGLQIDE